MSKQTKQFSASILLWFFRSKIDLSTLKVKGVTQPFKFSDRITNKQGHKAQYLLSYQCYTADFAINCKAQLTSGRMPMTMMTMTSMFETHDKLQLVGILGITLSYIIAVIFNTLNGIGGMSVLTASSA